LILNPDIEQHTARKPKIDTTFTYVKKDNQAYDENTVQLLREQIAMLEREKDDLEGDIGELRKKTKGLKKEDVNKKIKLLEREKEDSKKQANQYLMLCSQLGEEVIVLRNQLDKYSHFKK
jgi:hypothetical protein